MSLSEERSYTTESEVDDDSQEDPTFDVLEQTRTTLSRLSIKKKLTNCSIKSDDDGDDIEVEEEVEVVVPELDEKDQKSYEAIHKLIQEGKVDKLKLDQCKIYLKKHGLRMSGNKPTLIQRIQEHIQILDGGGERKYPASSFVLNCKGDACTGDIVMFEQNVYEMFSIASRSATGPPCGTRTVAGKIVKESYGAAKQQHTFTIEVLWSKGEKPFPPLHPLLIKGRNLYRIKTMRQKWEDEGERRKNLSEKHARGVVARSNREERVMLKSKRLPNLKSKHCNDKRGPSLQHLPQQERHIQKESSFHVNDKGGHILQQGCHENKTLQKDKHFHVNDKRGPILQHPSPVQLQQGWHGNKNVQKDNHFHANYKRGSTMQHLLPDVKLQQERHSHANQLNENRFHGSSYFPANGQRSSDNVLFNPHLPSELQHHHQRRHHFTNNNRQYTRMIPHGDRMHSSNYMEMGEYLKIPCGTMHPSTSRMNMEYSREIQYESMHPSAGINTGSSRAPAEYATGRGGTYNRGRR